MCAVSQFPPETHYVEVGGALVGYQVVGEGPIDLVQANGLGSNIDLALGSAIPWPRWSGAWPPSAATSCLIAAARVSRIGSAATPPPTWEDWTEDVRAVLDAVGSRRAAVMAAYDTGPMAILFAAMQPERVSELVLVNTGARFLRDDDYPIGLSPAEVDAFVATVEQRWGTPEAARFSFPSRADDEEFVRLAARSQRASASPRNASGTVRLHHAPVGCACRRCH